MRYLSAILSISLFTIAGMQVGFGEPLADSHIRNAATKTIALLQSTGKVWFEKQTCVSCHHQALPLMALKIARERGVPVNEELARQSASKAFSYFQSLDRAVQSTHVVDPAMDTGMHLLSGVQAGLPASLTTAVYARLIANYQDSDGSWTTLDDRPPQAHSRITATAVAVRAVQLYLPERLREEKAARTARARRWLLSATPRNTEDRTFQLLGYRWVDVPLADRQRAAAQLLAEQRRDGGWGQLPNLASDAYATGEALDALYQAGDIDVQGPAYQRGLRFLLSSQRPDGSWLVRTRLIENALVSPPYFETGFPYKEHQVISCMGTSRAVIALMRALPRVSSEPAPPIDVLAVTPKAVEPWMEVALFGTPAELRTLLDGGMDPNSKTSGGTTALMMAASDLTKVKLLVERGADVKAESKSRYTALMVACNFRATTDVVQFLLQNGANPGIQPPHPLFNASPVFFAVASGETEKVELLLSKGADLGQHMWILGMFPTSPLRLAIANGDTAMVRLLVKHGEPINRLDEDGISALTGAILPNNLQMVRTLISLGADVNQVDSLGMTPLMHAASIDFGDGEVAQALIQAGARPELMNKEGLTPVQLAAKYGHINVLRVLEPVVR